MILREHRCAVSVDSLWFRYLRYSVLMNIATHSQGEPGAAGQPAGGVPLSGDSGPGTPAQVRDGGECAQALP